MKTTLKGRCLVPGRAEGEVLKTSMPLSFWGGVDFTTGRVTDPFHELCGRVLTGKVLAFPFAKGSSGAGQVLLELIRAGAAPAAIVNIRTEPVLAAGPVVARHFYRTTIPVVTLDEESFALLETGQRAEIDAAEGAAVVVVTAADGGGG